MFDKLETFRSGLGAIMSPCHATVVRRRRGRTSAAAVKRSGKLDILVNNAGITRDNLAMRNEGLEWTRSSESISCRHSV